MALTKSRAALYAEQDRALATAREILAELRQQAAERTSTGSRPSGDDELPGDPHADAKDGS